MAQAIADHFSVSVLIHDTIQGKKVSGRLVARNLQEALSAFSFLLSCKFRSDAGGGTWMVGGEAVQTISDLPSYGLSAGEVAGLSRDGARLVADRIVLQADEGKTKEIGAIVEHFKHRASIVLELFLLDVASGSIDRVNAWLDQVRIGAGYIASASVVAGAPALAGGPLVQAFQKIRGPVYDVQVRGLLDLIERERTARVELRHQLQVLSGSETFFSSGEIVERELITREPETGKDLISRVERRTIGLQLRLRGVSMPDGWHFHVDLEDSNFVAQRERSNKLQTERILVPGAGMILLASFTRQTDEMVRRSVPILGDLGKWGRRVFTKSDASKSSRSLMLLARPILAP